MTAVRYKVLPHGEGLPPPSYRSELAAGLDLSFFDAAVNMGSTEAIRILQFSLGVAIDGIWGPRTQAALTLAKTADAVTNFTSRRQKVYEMTPGFQYFGTDWTRRTAEIGTASLKMVQA